MSTTEKFSVKGMTCNNCVSHVEKALQGIPGITSVNVDLDNQWATVEYDPSIATVDAMRTVVKEAGYTLEAHSS